jgi:hypothetical protein
MTIELDEVEIGLLENGLRALEHEWAEGAEDSGVHLGHGTVVISRTARRFTLLRAKLAGLEMPIRCAGTT